MDMRRYKIENREFWTDKSMDLANLSAVALIFSQFVTDKVYWQAIIFGVILYLSLLVLVFYLRKGA